MIVAENIYGLDGGILLVQTIALPKKQRLPISS